MENQNNNNTNHSPKSRVRHDNEPSNSTSNNQDNENQDESVNDMHLNNSKPIIIESMNLATHSNMETTIDADMVDTFKESLEFKRRTDPKFNQETLNTSNANPPELLTFTTKCTDASLSLNLNLQL